MSRLYVIYLLCLNMVSASPEPLIVAHRGASHYAPENTLAAFELAWAQDADAIECDVRQTADGVVVCIHDADTKRVSKENKTVALSTFSDLRSVDVGSWFSPEFKSERVPRLSEVIATVPSGKQIFIEVKTDRSILPQLFDIISKSSLQLEQFVIIAFDSEVIRQVKATFPEMTANWLVSRKIRWNGTPGPTLASVLKTLRSTDADGIGGKGNRYYDAAFISGLKEAGFSCHVWTVDDPRKAVAYKQLGIQSITTNQPDKLASIFN